MRILDANESKIIIQGLQIFAGLIWLPSGVTHVLVYLE